MSDRAVAVERKVKETRQVERQAALDRFRPTAGLGAEWVWLRVCACHNNQHAQKWVCRFVEGVSEPIRPHRSLGSSPTESFPTKYRIVMGQRCLGVPSRGSCAQAVKCTQGIPPATESSSGARGFVRAHESRKEIRFVPVCQIISNSFQSAKLDLFGAARSSARATEAVPSKTDPFDRCDSFRGALTRPLTRPMTGQLRGTGRRPPRR
eukprot:305234-Pyramimonas_sp.AAC.1